MKIITISSPPCFNDKIRNKIRSPCCNLTSLYILIVPCHRKMNWISSIILFISFSNLCKSSDSSDFSDLSTSTSSEENLTTLIGGSKRKFSETVPLAPDETSHNNSENFEESRSNYYYNAIRKVFDHFDTKLVPDYIDPVDIFLDKFIRRSFYIKLSNTIDSNSDIWLWDLPCTTELSCSWHSGAFFYLIMNDVHVAEHVLIEYFEHLQDRWKRASGHQFPFPNSYFIHICKYAINEKYSDLFEAALDALESEQSALTVLLLLKQHSELFSKTEKSIWQLMCLRIVEKFPRVSYHSALRIDNFIGASQPSDLIFIHFSPILSTLLTKTKEEFDEDSDSFEIFILFQTGDFENILPIGVGGLIVVNQMFLRNRINLSAFSGEKDPLRCEIVERVLDALFLGLTPIDFVKIVFDQKALSIFEAFLKYYKGPPFDEIILALILEYFISETDGFDDKSDFVLALLSYREISSKVWNAVKNKFVGQPNRISTLFHFHTIYHASKRDPNGIIDLFQNRNIQLEIKSSVIDFLSDRMKKPIQLDIARIFLARSCGIPLEITENLEIMNENFEWSETVGFINFYVERMASLLHFPRDTHVKFYLQGVQ